MINMIKDYMKIFTFIISISIYLLGATDALAGPSVSAYPLVINEDVEARDILTYDITLTNTGTQPVTVYPSVNNISIDDGGKIQEFKSPVMSDRTASLASWIEISRAGINLQKGESKIVTMTLRINPDPIPGEYNAYVGFGWGGNRDQAERQVQSGNAPGTVVTVNLGKETNELLRLSRFFIDKFITSSKNQSATYSVVNPGDEPIVPRGEIIFYDKKGIEVAAIPVNPAGDTIPANGETEFNVTVPSEGLFGKYKAFLSVDYGLSQVASVQDTAFFYVLPIKTMFIILIIVIILVILGAFFFHKKFMDHEVHHDGSDRLNFHVKDSVSDSQDHDIDLKQNDN